LWYGVTRWRRTRRRAGSSTHEVFSADERLAQLDTFKRLGLATVEYSVSSSVDIGEIRRGVWAQHGREGVVLLVLGADGKMMRMLKLKSIWYVLNRGLRERAKVMRGTMSREEVRLALRKKAGEKLAIFSMRRGPEYDGWLAYADAFAGVVHGAVSSCDPAAWNERIATGFPQLVGEAETIAAAATAAAGGGGAASADAATAGGTS
jgi:hypothetical protein